MSLITIEDTFKFTHDSDTSGVIRAHLVEIGEMARSLQYTSAEYDTKAKEIIFTKGAVRSDPLPARDSQTLSVIYRLLWFEVQAQRCGLSGQLAERIQEHEQKIKALETQTQELGRLLNGANQETDGSNFPVRNIIGENSAPAVPDLVAALVPLESAPQKHKEVDSIAADDPKGALHRLREQARSIDGYIAICGARALYSRPRALDQDSVFDRKRQSDGLRYIFLIPDELRAMQLFITHDQDLITRQCLRSEVAS